MSALIAAVGDLHVGEDNVDVLRDGFTALDRAADVLLVAGDLTRRGTPQEAELAAGLLAEVEPPVVAVLGNHDVASDCGHHVSDVLASVGVTVLEGSSVVLDSVVGRIGIAGVRGFCGGFGAHALTGFGEPLMRRLRVETEAIAGSLDRALSNLRSGGLGHVDRCVALLHYSPIRDTVLGEPPEIHPFLGSSLLSVPIDRHEVDLVVHGHAHHGRRAGRTAGGAEVHNVALPLLDGLFALLTLD